MRLDQAGARALASQVTASSKAGFVSALCAASLLTTPIATPAISLNDAIIDVSESSYPIIKALSADRFGPFCNKLGGLILEINPDKLGRSIDLAIDVFNSVPAEKLDAFSGTVKEAFAKEKTDSCTLVPLPPTSLAERFGTVAKEKVGSDKLKAFDDKWGPTLGALSKTESAICLPPVETLNTLALAQADLARSFSPEASGRFGGYVTPVLKSKFTLGAILPIAKDAEKLAPTATNAEKAAFQAAGKRVEKAATKEAQDAKFAQLKARSEAIAAAKAEGRAPPPAAPAKQPSLAAEELAAEREAAAKKAADLKAAALEKKAAEAQALKEAEAARIAELKAKSAAIAAAKAGATP